MRVPRPNRARTVPEPAAPPRAAASAQAWPPERKLRLYACGCCRQWWAELAPVCRRAVEAAERYADGVSTVDELAAAWTACRRAEGLGLPGDRSSRTTECVHRVAAAVFTPWDARSVAADLRPWRGDSVDNDEVDAVCRRVHDDVFGGPPGSAPDPLPLTPDVLRLAGRAYASGDFSALPVLADALQTAGCDDAVVLAHCRGGGPHVRGCWVLDRILGKGEPPRPPETGPGHSSGTRNDPSQPAGAGAVSRPLPSSGTRPPESPPRPAIASEV